MNTDTLEKIVDTSFFVENKINEGNKNAKANLKKCLPLEVPVLQELAQDTKTDFMEGYDNRFPRINMSVVNDSYKQINGVNVPAFAVYDVFSQNNTYEKEFVISSTTEYKYEHALSKLMVPHNPTMMKLYNHVWRNYDYGGEAPFLVLGISGTIVGLLCTFLPTPFLIKSIFLPVVVISMLSVIYGIVIAKFSTNSVGISRKFSHTFSGMIPDDVRKTVVSERPKFNKILLVEESYNWKIDDSIELQKKPNSDPLIVGEIKGKHFLITSFVVTPLEKLLAQEFSA